MKQCTSCMKFIYVLFVIHLSITTVCAQTPNNTPQYVLNSIASVENKERLKQLLLYRPHRMAIGKK
mgnify:CR=1 FL=1